MCTFRNIVYETDRLFTRMFEENSISGAAHGLKRKCEEAKKRVIQANRDLNDSNRNKYASPAGWYECDVAKRTLSKREAELYSAYQQLKNELRRCKERKDKR